MATPLINTVPSKYVVPLDPGSGSSTYITTDDWITSTSIGPSAHLYYRLEDFLESYNSASSPVTVLREKPADRVGRWLASTDGMVPVFNVVPLLPYAKILDELKVNLSTTLTYVARCLCMQRSAIYKWYEGRQPHAANRSRLETIREFASAWKAANLPPLRNYWDFEVPGVDMTLGSCLSAETLDINGLRLAIINIARKPIGQNPPQPLLGFPGRKRDRKRDRERLGTLAPPISFEDDESGGN